MKFLVAVLALAAVAHADVSHVVNKDSGASVVSQEADVLPDQYSYSYQTSNGIAAQESGVLKNAGSEAEALEVQGSHSYTDPTGNVVQLTYVANENGYQPQGAHLPVAPAPEPIPEYILRAIEYTRTHPSRTEN